jgi:hypothetical protein
MQREASRLLSVFKKKSQWLKELAVQCFTRSAGLTEHSAMHMAQNHFLETTADAKDFTVMVREKLDGRNPDEVLNMERMPIMCSDTIPTRCLM